MVCFAKVMISLQSYLSLAKKNVLVTVWYVLISAKFYLLLVLQYSCHVFIVVTNLKCKSEA